VAREVTALEEKLKVPGADIDEINEELASQRAELLEMETGSLARVRESRAAASLLAEDLARSQATVSTLEARIAEANVADAEMRSVQAQLAAENLRQKVLQHASEEVNRDVFSQSVRIQIGNERFDLGVANALKNPQLLIYKLQSNAYKFAWALIPISTPFVWLLFAWRREFKLFDHAVFVTYSLCFMLLLATATVLVMRVHALEDAAALAILLVPALHVYRQVREAYVVPRWGALWRTLLLLAFGGNALGLFGALLLAMGTSS
jgi:hypothetical protein